ncbi:hypothetical protein GCM10007047_17510 [Cerasicoccus arenae]|uniref:Uncharacterized protein n=2 Tax=Cerasicoccus arenae TaxID=424488 RepID=A0A8J3GEV4_9BACT|nr:hypothetical protein GCM10007047_17510 [Cerasicoccus arenae]
MRFVFIDESGGALFLKDGNQYKQISNVPYSISSPVQVSPGERLEIYKNVSSVDPEQKLTRVKVATLTAPSPTEDDSTSVLSVIRLTGGESGFQNVYYDDDTREFPERSFRVLNLGQRSMAIALDDIRATVDPGEAKILQPEPDRKNRVSVQVAESGSTGWQMLYQSVAMLRPSERVTGVLVFSPSGMRHTYTEDEIKVFGEPPPGHVWLTYTEKL